MNRVISVKNETETNCTRITKGGKKITYNLKIIQQPERARACGSGAKSSADRRPIDPPPIVELKIFEGENADNDITFSINANYFLFATLEQARHMAHGRVQQDSSRMVVLTGTPVAGLVYLDRPKPAGYFLFSDLSVRHEGLYRLSFNLYEELKEEKDEDAEQVQDGKAPGVGPAHVTHRLEVKSKPFSVYSAKKFPGLEMSTDLSRLVAEQGCRVRIRRDVRKKSNRKKDKDMGDDDDYDDEGEMYTAPNGTNMGHRPRSSSIDSHKSIAPAPTIPGRPSDQDLNQGYHNGVPSNNAGVAQAGHGYHNAYNQGPADHYPTPHYSSASSYSSQVMPPPSRPGPVQQSYINHPGSGQTSPTTGYPPYHNENTHHMMPMAPSSYDDRYSSRTNYSDSRQSQPVEYRNVLAPPPPTQASYQYPPTQPHHIQAPGYQAVPPPQNGYSYAAPRDSVVEHVDHERRSTHKMLPALVTGPQIAARLLEPSSPSSAGPSPVFPEPPRSFSTDMSTPAGGKRSFGQVFDTQHMSGPMRSGARPVAGIATSHDQSHHLAVDHDEACDEIDPLRKFRMQYKRADGRRLTKALPNERF